MQRYRACFLGLTACDALGAPVDGKAPGTFPPVTDMEGGENPRTKPGQWTASASMALSLAESLIEYRGFDAVDQLLRYARWWHEGSLTSAGACVGIDAVTQASLARFEEERDHALRAGEAAQAAADETAGDNGAALARLAPVALFYARKPAEALTRAWDSARVTHARRESADACRILAGLLIGALQGRSKQELLSPGFTPVEGHWKTKPLCPAARAVAGGSFMKRQPPEITAGGGAAAALEAALWAFATTSDFKSGALSIINLGNDASFAGAIYGQLAGAHYGERAIPILWRHKLAHRYLIEAYATKLFELA